MQNAESDASQPPGTRVTGTQDESAERRPRWSIAASAGALLSAFIASACCIGPLVLVLLGIGGGTLLTVFEPYRPVFTVVTLGLLGLGFWLEYRKPKPVANADGIACDCPTPRASRVGRVMLWVATPLVLGFLAFPYVVPLIWG